MARTIPSLTDSETRIIPNPAVAATPAGLVRVPFSMAWITDSRDASNLLTGTVTDDGAGTISAHSNTQSFRLFFFDGRVVHIAVIVVLLY